MNVFTAICSALRDAESAFEKMDYSKMQGILQSLGIAVGGWVPYNNNDILSTSLVVNESIPGRLVFETRSAVLSTKITFRKYRTVVRDRDGELIATTMQVDGVPAQPGERAALLNAFEEGFETALSKELEDDDVVDS